MKRNNNYLGFKFTTLIITVTLILIVSTILLAVRSFTTSNAIAFNSSFNPNINGEQVAIMGFVSPIKAPDGSLIYLSSTPYNNTPFLGNRLNPTRQNRIFDTIAVHPLTEIYTKGLITITGIAEIGNFADNFGFSYTIRINNATYEKVGYDSLPSNLRLFYLLHERSLYAPTVQGIDHLLNLMMDFAEGETNLDLLPSSYWQHLIDGVEYLKIPTLLSILSEFQQLNNELNRMVLTNNRDSNQLYELVQDLDEIIGRFLHWSQQFNI